MPDFDSALQKGNGESIDTRDVRALTECMTVLPIGGDVYDVTTESGSSYRVDSREGRCTCPDHQYREVKCKHRRRVAYATGETPIPQWADTDAVDSHLGDHVEGQPRQVASDGGMIEAGDEGEIIDSDDDVDDSDDGGCWCEGKDLPCFDHFESDDDSDDDRDTPTRHEPADFGGGETTGVQDL